jgi:hypothetical protein
LYPGQVLNGPLRLFNEAEFEVKSGQMKTWLEDGKDKKVKAKRIISVILQIKVCIIPISQVILFLNYVF